MASATARMGDRNRIRQRIATTPLIRNNQLLRSAFQATESSLSSTKRQFRECISIQADDFPQRAFAHCFSQQFPSQVQVLLKQQRSLAATTRKWMTQAIPELAFHFPSLEMSILLEASVSRLTGVTAARKMRKSSSTPPMAPKLCASRPANQPF